MNNPSFEGFFVYSYPSIRTPMQIALHRLSLVSLVCIFLVVLAGSVVRMTGSGMGCPDWPKCFGYYVPPTSVETLTWSENRTFDAGNIIIHDEGLLVAKSDFTSSASFNPENWEPYTKHDYASFNATHTWVEFVNRLLGAFTGLPVLALFVCSLFYLKRDPIITASAFGGVVLLGFEAWLGKEVVDGNLIPHQITYHMFGALALVALFTFIVLRTKPQGLTFRAKRDSTIVRLGIAAIALILIQIYLGTSVREEVDAIGKSVLLAMPDWVETLSINFKIHRTFSLAVLAVIITFSVKVIRGRTISTWPRILIASVFLEILFGMGLVYMDLPGPLQPLHLLFAFFNFAMLLGILLSYLQKTVR